MKRLIILIIIMVPLLTRAQENYIIDYTFSDILMPMTINGEKRYVQRDPEQLVIGDSLAILYRPRNGSIKKDGIYGVKPLHHAYFITVSGMRYYSVVAWPKKNHPYLIHDTVMKRNWIITSDTRPVLDYTCTYAYYITPKNDTISAWFTRDIPFPLGPFFQSGLPGLILEVEDHTRDIHVVAKKIQKGSFTVTLPEVDGILSSEEYHRTMGKGKTK